MFPLPDGEVSTRNIIMFVTVAFLMADPASASFLVCSLFRVCGRRQENTIQGINV